MSVKANWHLDALDALEYEDPMQVGIRVDIRDRAALRTELSALVKKEASYAHTIKLDCPLKWTVSSADGTGSRNPCYTCPHYTSSDDDEMSLLCTMGRRQNDLLDMLAVIGKQSTSLDEELCRACSDLIESSAELGDALVCA